MREYITKRNKALLLEDLIGEYFEKLPKSAVCKNIKKFDPSKHKFFMGDADFKDNLDIKNLGVLEVISGGVYFTDSNVTDLGNLRIIGDYAEFKMSKLKNLGNIEIVGTISLGNDIEDLGKLTTVVYSFYGNDKIKTLKNLKFVYSHFYIEDNNNNINDLGDLTYVRVISGEIGETKKEYIREHLKKKNEESIIEKGINYVNTDNGVYTLVKSDLRNGDLYNDSTNPRKQTPIISFVIAKKHGLYFNSDGTIEKLYMNNYERGVAKEVSKN